MLGGMLQPVKQLHPLVAPKMIVLYLGFVLALVLYLTDGIDAQRVQDMLMGLVGALGVLRGTEKAMKQKSQPEPE